MQQKLEAGGEACVEPRPSFLGVGDEAPSEPLPPFWGAGDKAPAEPLPPFWGAGDEAREIMVLPPSSRRQARVHWTLTFKWFEPLPYQKEKTSLLAGLFFLERVTRLELATSTLARWRSTG